MQAVMPWMSGPVLPTDKTVEALEAPVVAGDRIVLEGDNQKQADFLSRSLVRVDAKKVHDLHLIISSISRPEHLDALEFSLKCWLNGLSLIGDLVFCVETSPPQCALLHHDEEDGNQNQDVNG
jgi:hypothetical protein